MATWNEAWQTAVAVVGSLGGGGLVVLGLSNYIGKLWAHRLLAGERHVHEMALAKVRSEFEAQNAAALAELKVSLDLGKEKLASAHADKVGLYRTVADMVAEMILVLSLKEAGASPLPMDRWAEFERGRLRAFGYLGMLAPQPVMDAFSNVIDYLQNVLDGRVKYGFPEVRRLSVAMLNEIRIDLGVDAAPIGYRGNR